MNMVSIVCIIQVCMPTMYLCDNIMQNMANSITARDLINNMLEQNNNAELSRLAMLIGTTATQTLSTNGLIISYC